MQHRYTNVYIHTHISSPLYDCVEFEEGLRVYYYFFFPFCRLNNIASDELSNLNLYERLINLLQLCFRLLLRHSLQIQNRYHTMSVVDSSDDTQLLTPQLTPSRTLILSLTRSMIYQYQHNGSITQTVAYRSTDRST